MKNFCLIGLGPHAKRIYYPFLEKYCLKKEAQLICLIELEGQQKNVYDFLRDRKIQPQRIYFTDSSTAFSDSLPPQIVQFLESINQSLKLDRIIISSHPKSHKAYLKWAISQDIDALVDKPILYPDLVKDPLSGILKIARDFSELIALYARSKSNVLVQVQRRAHTGYVHIRNYLKAFLQEFQVPISYIDIAHADGMWVMPNEWGRENHPYKYGTGKLMHSGYHFVDLLAWLLELNQSAANQQADELEMYVQSFLPSDFMMQLQPQHYQNFFQKDLSTHFSADYIKTLKQYGELDLFILSQFKKNNSILTTTYLNLQQNSFSRRASSTLPTDIYKGNGRVRHERINIQVSTLLNVQVHSYQSYQIKDYSELNYGEGYIKHFDILFFRNSDLVGGKTFEKIEIGNQDEKEIENLDASFSHNEASRERIFVDFMRGEKSESDLIGQIFTMQLIVKIYECMALARSGKIPCQKVRI